MRPLSSQIAVDTNLCKGDGACVAVCPSRFLTLNEKGFPEEVADHTCILCGHYLARSQLIQICARETARAWRFVRPGSLLSMKKDFPKRLRTILVFYAATVLPYVPTMLWLTLACRRNPSCLRPGSCQVRNLSTVF